jgi:shikimate dehydrogenase
MNLRFAVIGSPIAHSKSPAMHMAAYRALGLPHVYEKIDTPSRELPERVALLRDGTLAGINVTVPHKTSVLSLADELDTTAQAIGAANTLVRSPAGRIVAHNTDAPALEQELLALAPADAFTNRTAVVLGTGGAARAAIFALGKLGVARVVVRGRTRKRELADILALANPSASLSFEPFAAPPVEPTDLCAIVQATTAGMTGAPPGEIAIDAIAWPSLARPIVYDVVYAPPLTPLLDRAASTGLPHAGGLGMLVRQGALAFELWLGVRPPLDVMRAAIA